MRLWEARRNVARSIQRIVCCCCHPSAWRLGVSGWVGLKNKGWVLSLTIVLCFHGDCICGFFLVSFSVRLGSVVSTLLFVCLYVCSLLSVSVCLSLCLSVYLIYSVYLSACSSVCLCVRVFVPVFSCMSVCDSLSISVYAYN